MEIDNNFLENFYNHDNDLEFIDDWNKEVKLWEIFYDSGELKYSCTYFYGHKHGEEKFYYDNGQIQSLIKYDYGKEISDIMRWNKNGELLY